MVGSALVECGVVCKLQTTFVVPGAFVKKDFIFVKLEEDFFSSFTAGSAVAKIEVWTACVSSFDRAGFAENEAACVSSFLVENDVILIKFEVAWVSSCVDGIAFVKNGIEVVVAVGLSSTSFVGEAAVVENVVIVVIAADAGAVVNVADVGTAVDKNAALKVGAEVVVVIFVGVIKFVSVFSALVVVVLVLVLVVAVVVVVVAVVSFAQHNCPSHPPSVAKCWTGFSSILGSPPMIVNKKYPFEKYDVLLKHSSSNPQKINLSWKNGLFFKIRKLYFSCISRCSINTKS